MTQRRLSPKYLDRLSRRSQIVAIGMFAAAAAILGWAFVSTAWRGELVWYHAINAVVLVLVVPWLIESVRLLPPKDAQRR